MMDFENEDFILSADYFENDGEPVIKNIGIYSADFDQLYEFQPCGEDKEFYAMKKLGSSSSEYLDGNSEYHYTVDTTTFRPFPQ